MVKCYYLVLRIKDTDKLKDCQGEPGSWQLHLTLHQAYLTLHFQPCGWADDMPGLVERRLNLRTAKIYQALGISIFPIIKLTFPSNHVDGWMPCLDLRIDGQEGRGGRSRRETNL